MRSSSLTGELWAYLEARMKWWLVPLVLVPLGFIAPNQSGAGPWGSR